MVVSSVVGLRGVAAVCDEAPGCAVLEVGADMITRWLLTVVVSVYKDAEVDGGHGAGVRCDG